MSDIVEMTSK